MIRNSIGMVALFALVGCGGGGSSGADAGTSRAKTVAGLTGAAASGKTLYTSNCSGCHGPEGKGTTSGIALAEPFTNDTLEKLAGYVLNGIPTAKPPMPSYATLTDQQIADILAHGKATFK